MSGAKNLITGTTAIVMVLVSSLLIAAVPNFSKLAYESGASLPLVIACRFLVTVAMLAVYLSVSRQSFVAPKRVLRLCILSGIASAAMSFGILGAITMIDISLVILILYLHPVFVAWLGHLRGTYVLDRYRLFCCGLILAGLALALSVSFGNINVAGLALASLGCLGAAGLVIFSGDAVAESTSSLVSLYTSITALAIILVVSLFMGPVLLPATPIGWFGVFATGAAFCLGLVLFFAAVPKIGLVRATLIASVEPVLAILLAMALFGERLSLPQWLGVAIVVAGLLLLELPPKEVERLKARLRQA